MLTDTRGDVEFICRRPYVEWVVGYSGGRDDGAIGEGELIVGRTTHACAGVAGGADARGGAAVGECCRNRTVVDAGDEFIVILPNYVLAWGTRCCGRVLSAELGEPLPCGLVSMWCYKRWGGSAGGA